MPRSLGAHSPLLAEARALRSSKARREQRRFLFEGATLLSEARESGVAIRAVFATQAAYDAIPSMNELESDGTAVWIVAEAALARLSDVVTPSGIVAVAEQRFADAAAIFGHPGPAIVLAGISDPGNAGTIARSAEAFGAAGVLFGEGSVEPYHPKVVRSAMGSLFRVAIARISVGELRRLAGITSRPILGLSAKAHEDVVGLPNRAVIVVGQERSGLGAWGEACTGFCKISMRAGESLNAAIAASIALYEGSKSRGPT